MLSPYNAINLTLCAEIKTCTLFTNLLFNSILQNYNRQFLIPNYEMNPYFTQHKM